MAFPPSLSGMTIRTNLGTNKPALICSTKHVKGNEKLEKAFHSYYSYQNLTIHNKYLKVHQQLCMIYNTKDMF